MDTRNEDVPAWKVISGLGYKPRLFLSASEGGYGVVLLTYPSRPDLTGIAWWDGTIQPEMLKANIKWSRSAMTLLTWAAQHRVASRFDVLLHLLNVEVHRTSN